MKKASSLTRRALFISSLLLLISSLCVSADDDGGNGNGTDAIGAAAAGGGACGGWPTNSCAGGGQILVGVWLCESANPSDCLCGDGGCQKASWFGSYILDLHGDDNTCDTMGGWRTHDVGYRGEFPVKVRSFHYQVHPDDMQKANSHSAGGQYDVKVNLLTGDYCTGAPSDSTFEALDGNGNTPNWVLSQDYYIKSIRPYVDNYVQPTTTDSIGIKFVGFPGGHMGWPYNEIDCSVDRPLNVNGGCGSAVDQIWCVSPEDDPTGSPNWGMNSKFFVDNPTIDYADNRQVPWDWKNAKGGIPLGSVMFGPYEGKDKWSCDTSFEDFCTGNSKGRNPKDYCLAARFWNSSPNQDNWNEEGPGSTLQGEVYINMLNLCKNWGTSGFCFNTYDDIKDPDTERNVCYTQNDGHSSWLIDQNGNPYTEWPIYYDQVWVRIMKDTTGNLCDNYVQ